MANENKSSPRQIRYNLQTDTAAQNPLRHQWTFFILNSKRETGIIKQKIIQALSNSDNLVELESGVLVKEGALEGKLITLESEIGEIRTPYSVYASSKWYKDRTLGPMNDVEFAKYCEKYRVL